MDLVQKISSDLLPRLDPRKNRKITLSCLAERQDNVVCPIKLLLVLARRHGVVAATSIDQLFEDTRSSGSRTIVWLALELLLLCQVDHKHALGKEPANTN